MMWPGPSASSNWVRSTEAGTTLETTSQLTEQVLIAPGTQSLKALDMAFPLHSRFKLAKDQPQPRAINATFVASAKRRHSLALCRFAVRIRLYDSLALAISLTLFWPGT